MLLRLTVHNIALIKDATLSFDPQLNILSGETGAGKTALLFSLRLLCGARADSSMIRDGAATAEVEGVFSSGGRQTVIQRRIDASGKGRCSVDGRRVKVSELAELAVPLLDLHSQHENQSLLSTDTHVHYLDTWIGQQAAEAVGAYRSAFAGWRAAKADYDAILHAAQADLRDLELARFAVREIETVAPVKGEYEELEAELPALEHADALAQAAEQALQAIRREGGADEALTEASLALGRERGIDARLDALAELGDSLLAQVEDLAGSLRAYRDSLDFDPYALQQRLDRLAALDGLAKKYGPRMVDVFARYEEAQRIIAVADSSDDALAEAEAALAEADAALVTAADALAELRDARAQDFCEALAGACAQLGMGQVSFLLAASDLPRAAWTADGSQHVELLYSPGIGVAPRPLAKIASGGELSRVMLALVGEVDVAAAETLVFDEVDAGIGGATATLIGQRLREIARTHQVIVVTHLAQIAVFGQRQMAVRKQAEDGSMPQTTVRELSGDNRTAEIARMLSGTDADVSLDHARALLEAAQH